MDQNSNPPGDSDKPQIDLARKAAFMAMLKEAEDEAERDGWMTMDEALVMAEAIISKAEQRAAGEPPKLE